MSKYETDKYLYKIGMTITSVVFGLGLVASAGLLLLNGRTSQTDFMFVIVGFLAVCMIAMAGGHRKDRSHGDIVSAPTVVVTLARELPDTDLVYDGYRYDMFAALKVYDTWPSDKDNVRSL